MSLTYAIGDIHGALHKLRELVGRCEAHAGGRPHRYVFIGDYIDRGPDSAGVIRFLIELEEKMSDSMVTLMGNHEALLLAVIGGAALPENWFWQGGKETLRSYGVVDARALPHEHVDWLRARRLTYDDGQRFFVHAGVDPERPLDDQVEDVLLWIREPFLSDRRDYGRLIVHGHTPVTGDGPDLRNNRLDIDTGAGYGGPLTAAVFSEVATAPLGFLAVG